MSNSLDEDIVVMGVPLFLKIYLIFATLIMFTLWTDRFHVPSQLWSGFLIVPIASIFIFFTKYVIHEKGIDLLFGFVDNKKKYHGFLIHNFKWNEVKVVLVNENCIQLVDIKRKWCTSISSMYMQSPLGTKAEEKKIRRNTLVISPMDYFYREREFKTKLSLVGLPFDCRGLRLSPLVQTNFKHAILVIQKYGRYHLSPNERKDFDEELEKRYFTPNPPILIIANILSFIIMLSLYIFQLVSIE